MRQSPGGRDAKMCRWSVMRQSPGGRDAKMCRWSVMRQSSGGGEVSTEAQDPSRGPNLRSQSSRRRDGA
jgi:hypothetical protein